MKNNDDRSGCMDHDAHYRQMRDGTEDGLAKLETLDLDKVADFDDLLAAMSMTAFGGRNLGEAADVLEAMISDPECGVVLTLSGAMTVAKMGLVITQMVERGWVQAIISTGALMTHGLVELAGMEHYKAVADVDDKRLFETGYNRVYDTYEMEKNLNDLEEVLAAVFKQMPKGQRYGSHELCAHIGRVLDEQTGSHTRGIMVACSRMGVPIYIPAFTDSEMGLDLAVSLIDDRMSETGATLDEVLADFQSPFDPFRDLGHYTKFVGKHSRLGVFTIGGGVPRNWAQQAPCFLDVVRTALREEGPLNRFRYGVRICPEPVHWGGLSGCSYSEGVSWGKFLPQSEGGRYAEVHADATIAWPILVKAVDQRIEKRKNIDGSRASR